MAGRTCLTTTRVRFADTDAAGIVFYPNFYVWFDVGTHALLRAAGGALGDAEGRPRWPLPIVESGARFSAPLVLDDEITIRSTVVSVGTRSLRVEHVISRGEREVASGFETRVFIRRQGAQIVAEPIPAELRDALNEPVSTEGWA